MLDDFPELQAARKVWSSGDYTNAVIAFRAAIQAKPKNIRAAIEFARALGQQHEIAAAEGILNRAWNTAEAAGGREKIAMAQAFRGIFRQTRALEIFQNLHHDNALPAPILGEYAILLQQFGRYQDALSVIEQCVALAPQQPQPQLIRAKILRQLGRDGEAERTFRSLLELPQSHPMLQIGCWSELAQVYDRQQCYEQAFNAATKANQMVAQQPGIRELKSRHQQLNVQFAQLYESLDAPTIQRWTDPGSIENATSRQVAHLLSFPRTGTTLLEQALDAHPRIDAAPERVIFSKLIFPSVGQHAHHAPSFLENLDSASDDLLASQAERYFRLHAEVAGNAPNQEPNVLIDKNPNHTSLWAALVRILPHSRFVVPHRDPRDVVLSCYFQNFPASEYSVAFLDIVSTCELYLAERKTLQRLGELLAERIIHVSYEDMVSDISSEVARVLAFLELPPDPGTDDYLRATTTKLVNSPTDVEVRKPAHRGRIGRWQNYERFLKPHFDKLPAATD